VNRHHNGGHVIDTLGIKVARVNGAVRVEVGTGDFPVLLGVADGHGDDIVCVGPGVYYGEDDVFAIHVLRFNHDGHFFVDADIVVLVADIGDGHHGTIEAIRNLGAAVVAIRKTLRVGVEVTIGIVNARDTEVVSNVVVGAFGHGTGFAFPNSKVIVVSNIDVNVDFGPSFYTLSGVRLFGFVVHDLSFFRELRALHLAGSVRGVTDGEHGSSACGPDLVHAEGDGAGVLVLNGHRLCDVGIVIVSERFLPHRSDGGFARVGGDGGGVRDEGRHGRREKAVADGTHACFVSLLVC